MWTYRLQVMTLVILLLNSIFAGFILRKMKNRALVVVKFLAAALIIDEIFFCGYITLEAPNHIEDESLKGIIEAVVFLWFLLKAIILIIGMFW